MKDAKRLSFTCPSCGEAIFWEDLTSLQEFRCPRCEVALTLSRSYLNWTAGGVPLALGFFASWSLGLSGLALAISTAVLFWPSAILSMAIAHKYFPPMAQTRERQRLN